MNRSFVFPVIVVASFLGLAACGGGSSSPASPTPVSSSSSSSISSTPTPTPTPTPGTVTVAYVQDIKPILDADCVRCHGTRGGFNASTYANVMQAVRVGDNNSQLLVSSRGSMGSYYSGDRAAKIELIRKWIVENSAAETR